MKMMKIKENIRNIVVAVFLACLVSTTTIAAAVASTIDNSNDGDDLSSAIGRYIAPAMTRTLQVKAKKNKKTTKSPKAFKGGKKGNKGGDDDDDGSYNNKGGKIGKKGKKYKGVGASPGLVSVADGCPSLTTRGDCIYSKDGRSDFDGQPCRWCCGNACSSNGNTCEP